MLAISNYVIFIYLFVVTVNCNNYCGPKICNGTLNHTFCKYPGPSKKCYHYVDVKLSPEEKNAILLRLNQRRSSTARLGLGKFPPASNMLELRWVEELAKLAQLWADQCRPPSKLDEKDVCRDLYSITVGQCVASIVGNAPGLLVESLADIWYMQSINFKDAYGTSKRSTYEEFAQMIWASTNMVGCGRSRFTVEINDKFRVVERLVCNFAPRGPTPGIPLWMPGPPATNCPPRTEPQLDGLCAYPESPKEIDDIITRLENPNNNGVPPAYGKVRRELRKPSERATNDTVSQKPLFGVVKTSISSLPVRTTTQDPPLEQKETVFQRIMRLVPNLARNDRNERNERNSKANYLLSNFFLSIFGIYLVL